MQNKDYPRLLDCPFCGNEHPIITESSMGVQITCPSCQSKFRCDCTAGHDYSKSETVKHWNRRAQPTNLAKECPAMERVEGGIPYCSDKQAACDGCHPANGDRIRAKTDEEMADFIVEDCLDGKIHFCKNKPECMEILEQNECIPTEMCRQCALDWLRQPAEEGENE